MTCLDHRTKVSLSLNKKAKYRLIKNSFFLMYSTHGLASILCLSQKKGGRPSFPRKEIAGKEIYLVNLTASKVTT